METLETLRRKIDSADELGSVVKTLKAIAASSIGQYEAATASLQDYYKTTQLGLLACMKQNISLAEKKLALNKKEKNTCVIVFGSDQGLVGQFNESLGLHAKEFLASLKNNASVWVIGERMSNLLSNEGFTIKKLFSVPNSVSGITPLIGNLLQEIEAARIKEDLDEVIIFHNKPKGGSGYEKVQQRLLPLDNTWTKNIETLKWPTKLLPQIAGDYAIILQSLIKEYLFVSVYKACAESLTSENESRLDAMQRAEKNIGELLNDLNNAYHRLRQNAIDEELFDVISGFESLKKNK